MRTEFPHLSYVHTQAAYSAMSMASLRVLRDGHPNATAHELYARLLWPAVEPRVRSMALAASKPEVPGR